LNKRLDRVLVPIASTAAAFAATAAAAAVAAATPATTTAAAATTEAAAATTASAATESTATAAAATPAVFTWAGFVDGQGAAAVLLAVQGCDRRLGFLIGTHFDEPEPLGSAGVSVVDDLGGNNRAVLAKKLFELRAIDLVAQVPNVKLLTH
jgi:hypothetical protein